MIYVYMIIEGMLKQSQVGIDIRKVKVKMIYVFIYICVQVNYKQIILLYFIGSKLLELFILFCLIIYLRIFKIFFLFKIYVYKLYIIMK